MDGNITKTIILITNILWFNIAFGQKIIHSEIPPITESEYDYELRISYEGIIGSILILRIDSDSNATISMNEYAYKYSYKSLKKGDHSKDKFYRMEFPVDNKHVSKILELKNNLIPITDSLDCYEIGLDGNDLAIEYKDKNTIFKQNYWEIDTYNKDCLSKYRINEYYSILSEIRKEIDSNRIFLSKLNYGSYGTYGESYLTINNSP